MAKRAAKAKRKKAETVEPRGVELAMGRRILGRALWCQTGPAAEGVAQVLAFSVDPKLRRQGMGGLLLKRVVGEAKSHFARRRKKLRRMWLAVAQKQEIGGRAFLSATGFHHVGTLRDVMRGEDLLLYVRTFD